jgi:hypothetical protein
MDIRNPGPAANNYSLITHQRDVVPSTDPRKKFKKKNINAMVKRIVPDPVLHIRDVLSRMPKFFIPDPG